MDVSPVRRSQGFTLIELLIVLAVIGILVAIAIPRFKAFAMKSRRLESISYLHGVRTAQIAYFSDTDEFYRSLSSLENALSQQSLPSLYGARSLFSTDPTKGFALLVQGNLDQDLVQDTVLLRIGTSGVAGLDANPVGLSLLLDDIFF